ncbi:MAG: Rrf2 family transcriptional regulator [Oscillospiraceae bacterium]|nr:Rrf2 family transcriptional regulator [Oscillospiraceae bacterium]
MQLRVYTEYATQILQYLNTHNTELQSGAQIVEAVGITYPNFMAVANRLRQKGLIVSVQGRHGGFKLGRPAAKISFYDIFLCFDEELCVSQSLKADHGDGGMAQFLQSLQNGILTEMSSRTVADLAS